MLIVYRHELALGAGAVAGLFLAYALTLIPGLLLGGPASDRFGQRPVVVPFVALSPLATLLLVLGRDRSRSSPRAVRWPGYVPASCSDRRPHGCRNCHAAPGTAPGVPPSH